MFRSLRIFKKIEVVEEIPQLPVSTNKLKEMELNMPVNTNPDQLTSYFVDPNKSVFITEAPPKVNDEKETNMPLADSKKKKINAKKAPITKKGSTARDDRKSA